MQVPNPFKRTYQPLQARQWFKLRAPINWGISIVVFVPLVFILQNLLPAMFFADVISVALIFCLFFFYLHKRAIAIECSQCGKYIQTNTPWVCGVCGRQNLRVDDHPFVGRCENPQCGCEPKAYQCHHLDCRQLIFLTPDKSPISYARCVHMPGTERPVKRDKEKSEFSKLERGIHLGRLQVEKAKIDVELKGLSESLEPPRKKTIEEKFRAVVKNENDARKLKAAIDEEFKNDPVERTKRHAIVDDLMRELL